MENEVKIEQGFIAGPSGATVSGGDIAHRLANNNMDINVLRPFMLTPGGTTYVGHWNSAFIDPKGNIGRWESRAIHANASLLRDEWREIDRAVLAASEDELTAVADLKSRGLVYDLKGRGLGKLIFEYQDASDVNEAEVSMYGQTRGDNDLPDYKTKFLPLPIIYSDFFLNIRHLSSARSEGRAMDTDLAERKARKVAQKVEDILINGLDNFSFGEGVIYGYTDHPYRNLGELRADWSDSSCTGEMIVADVRDMLQALRNAKKRGPYGIYIASEWAFKLGDDYREAGDNRTIRERILAEDPEIAFVKPLDRLAVENVLCVSLRKETIRMITGLGVQTIEWTTEGGWSFHYKVVTIDIPQIRAEQNNRCGVAHYSVGSA